MVFSTFYFGMFNLKQFIILAIAVLIFQKVSSLSEHLILEYFKAKSIKYGTIFECAKKKEKLELLKNVSDLNRHLIFLSIKTKFENHLKTKHHHLGIVLDGDCLNLNDTFLQTCGNSNFFSSKHHWLIATTNKSKIINFLEETSINIDTDIQLLDSNTGTLFDVYNPAKNRGGILNYTEIGHYGSNRYFMKALGAKYEERKNLSGVTFKTIVVLPVSFNGALKDYLNNDDHPEVNTFNRFHSRLIRYCKDFYNFSMDIKLDKSWGYKNPDGTFDGLVGALERKQIDFGLSPLFVRDDRGKVILYGRNTWRLRAAFLFLNPSSRRSLENFVKPLSENVWICTAFLLFFSIILLKAVTSIERKRLRNKEIEASWSSSIIFTLGALCQQGTVAAPKMLSGRIIMLFIFFLSLLIYQFYSASIVSYLLQKPANNIKNLKDLLGSSMKVGCEDVLYDRDFFRRTTDEIASELYRKRILLKGNKTNFLKPERGLELVREGNFAFHVELATAYPIIQAQFSQKSICSLREIKLFPTQPMHANFQKDSPFRDMIDTCLHIMAERGILNRELKFWHPRKSECIQSRFVILNVGLLEFYPALVVLVVGMLISLVVFIIELLFSNYKMGKRLPFIN